jgi:O-antigen ligase
MRAKSSVGGSLYSAKRKLSMERRVSLFETTLIIIIFILGTGVLSIFPTIFIAGSPLSTYFWLASYLWVGGTLSRRYGIRWIFWLIRYRFLLGIVLLVALGSVLWSIDPILSLQRAIHLIGTTLIGFYVGFHVPPRITLFLLSRALTIIIVGNVFVALVFPGIGQEDLFGEHVWKGWHFHKNGLGFTATIACLFFSIRTLSVEVKNRWVYWALCALSFLLLIKSGSATALITLLSGAGIAISLSFAKRLGLSGQMIGFLLSFYLAMMGVVGAIIFFAGDIEMVTRLVGKSGDLTGRTGLWEMVVSLIKERPWLGFGYGALWSPKPGTESVIGPLLENQLGWLPPHAHNGFLNIASESGLPIAIIATIFSIQSIIKPLRLYLRWPSPSALLVVALLCALIIRAFSEPVIFTDRSLNWIIFIALPILLLRSAQRIDMVSKKQKAPGESPPNHRNN